VLRTVTCSLTAQLPAPATVELQIAVAALPSAVLAERLEVRLDGRPAPVVELPTPVGGRVHVVRPGAGRLEVSYRAEVQGRAEPVAVEPLDASTFLRPSRYAESDRLAAVAAAELGALVDPQAVVRATAAWVGRRLAYVPGSSSGTDGAVDTLLAGAGVCRDYAHLTVALLRARDVPARLVSAYAPGLSPMDFHAVVEALVDGAWQVVDPTLLAPRAGLVRIATGRDAADTAFLSSTGGELRLETLEVTATTDGDLPVDDLAAPVLLG
jgi:transglutaminase-like putative cysteine protease